MEIGGRSKFLIKMEEIVSRRTQKFSFVYSLCISEYNLEILHLWLTICAILKSEE